MRASDNVCEAEVEHAIYEHTAVHEAAVFGLPHKRLGKNMAVTVYRKTGH